MATQDQTRISNDRARPRVMELWWALRPLTSVVRFMQTGAHPDDETSGMLAALAFRDGISISYACSTRGEGGQNDIGTEAGASLGALRTREMERACDVLGMRMYWLSTGSDDTITDFGFSKSGTETFARWGRERTLLRFAEIIREERPDIICPTFLDVPGQHGHHRAMTEAAHAVMDVAADPSLPTNLPPWQVKKLYLPAWSGAGQSYDDDEPPPASTLVISGQDVEPMSGWGWERIGQQSRAFHRTQGMGRWSPAGESRDWPLHLADTRVAGPDVAIWSGLPRRLSDLADIPGSRPISRALREADAAIDRALGAFPEFDGVARAAAVALMHVREARSGCPSEVVGDIGHRLAAKETELGHVLRLAQGAEVRARFGRRFLPAGTHTTVEIEGAAESSDASSPELDLPNGWSVRNGKLEIAPDVPAHDAYPTSYDPRAPAAPAVVLSLEEEGVLAEVRLPLESGTVVLPRARATLDPSTAFVNLASSNRELSVGLSGVSPKGASEALTLPDGWQADRSEAGFRITMPGDTLPGVYELSLTLDGKPAASVQEITLQPCRANA